MDETKEPAAEAKTEPAKPTLYLETSVPSYLAARSSRDLIVAAHQQITREWWDKRRGSFAIYVSEVVLFEAGRGDPEPAKQRLELLSSFAILDLTPRVAELTKTYLDELRIPEPSARDAAHLAFAAAHGIDYLLTWNCRHIANAFVRLRLRTLNERLGVSTPVICTPEELLHVP